MDTLYEHLKRRARELRAERRLLENKNVFDRSDYRLVDQLMRDAEALDREALRLADRVSPETLQKECEA